MSDITLEQKQVWMIQCLKTGAELYGIIPWRILKRLYRKRYKLDEAEIKNIFESIDSDDRGFEEFEGEVVDANLIGTKAYEMLKEYQAGKPYFIPNENEIEIIAENGFLINTPEAKRMLDTIKNMFEPDEEEAKKILDIVQRKISLNCMPSRLLSEVGAILGRELAFKDSEEEQKFMEVLMYFNNNCRMIIHKGHTPKWLANNPGMGVY